MAESQSQKTKNATNSKSAVLKNQAAKIEKKAKKVGENLQSTKQKAVKNVSGKVTVLQKEASEIAGKVKENEATQQVVDAVPFKDKIKTTAEWAKAHPYKALGLGVIGLVSLRSRGVRRAAAWSLSTLGAMTLKSLVKNQVEDMDMPKPDASQTNNSASSSH